jgi:hypothetical protein
MLGGRLKDERGSALSIVAEILGVFAAAATLWEVGARTDVIGGPSPIQRVQEAIDGPSNGSESPTPTTDGSVLALEVPQVQLSGDCAGYTLTWNQVQAAESYNVKKDGETEAETTDTTHTFLLDQDGQTHEYRVQAVAGEQLSDLSEPIPVGPCPPA